MTEAARRDAVRRAGLSPFLTAGLARSPDLAPLFLEEGAVAAVQRALRSQPELTVRADLRRQRDRLAVALALADLSGEWPFERVARAISDFADSACDRALTEALRRTVPGWDGERAEGFAILALGKHGGRELNYSSDIDPILIYDPVTLPTRRGRDARRTADRVARAWVELMQARDAEGYVFRVDLRLRPTPEVSPPALPIDSAIAHYEGAALPWERAAMVRARAAAGDRPLGERFLEQIRPFVWRRSIDYGAAAELTGLAARIRQAAGDQASDAPGGDLKRGGGGIRAAEFFVQAHQLIHGGRDPSLRSPNLLDALCALIEAGRVDRASAERLAPAYRRLRTVEHRLQMMDDRQTHSLPVDRAKLDEVARLDGLVDGEELLASLHGPVRDVAELFDELDTRPASTVPAAPASLAKRMEAAGFNDGAAGERVVTAWRASAAPTLRSAAAQEALEDVLPALIAGLGQAADPLTALHRLDDVIRRMPSTVGLFRLLGANPSLAKLLADVMAGAPALAEMLADRPQLLDRLLDASAFDAPATADESTERWSQDLADLPYERALDGLRDRVGEERFAIGVQAVLNARPPARLSAGYAAVAETAVRVGLDLATAEFEGRHGRVPGSSLVVLALGRLGGEALTHASDLDIVFLHGGVGSGRADGATGHDAATYFNRLGQRVIAALSVPTASGPLYDVDVRLRPSGAQGPLVPTIGGFRRYGLEQAWTWELMAFARARVIAGEAEDRRAAEAALDDILRAWRDGEAARRDVLGMRARMDEAKPPRGPFDLKLLPGGLVDAEFLIHAVQLESGEGLVPQLDRALAIQVERGLLPHTLQPAVRLLSDALFLLRLTAPDGGEPASAARARTAAGCGVADWSALLQELFKARRMVASAWADHFGETREIGDE